MGYYLNSAQVLSLYKSEVDSPYFVDKSLLLKELFPLVKSGNKHICITRPRRFGKSVMVAMVGAFFSKGIDSGCIFDSLKIAQASESGSTVESTVGERFDYREYMNQYNVIYINFIEAANESSSYQEFISSIKELLQEDLREAFPEVRFRKKGTVIQDLRMIYEKNRSRFILVFDEWDCIFHKSYISNEDRKFAYIFLKFAETIFCKPYGNDKAMHWTGFSRRAVGNGPDTWLVHGNEELVVRV
ncbi:MAG: AAA family ATPase [Lachnospiraceae bacterium]|nr:AAA family ATPase [Lachnospiraceae bacterium]